MSLLFVVWLSIIRLLLQFVNSCENGPLTALYILATHVVYIYNKLKIK